MPDWFLILAGLVVLVFAAELLVRGAVGIALALGISKLMVGLTIVAFGTSAPELVVAVVDVLRPDELLRENNSTRGAIALGTVFGSNVANICLILGLTVLIRPMPLVGSNLRFEITWLLLAVAATCLPLLQDDIYTRLQGGALLCMLVAFTLLLIQRERRRNRTVQKRDDSEPDREQGGHRFITNLVLVLVGVLGLRLGAIWLVGGCAGLAKTLGLSEGMISATIIAIGSSLPELATAILAARRGHPELVIGNILGSNFFNITMVLGATAALHPIPLDWNEHGMRLGAGVLAALVLGGLTLFRDRIGRLAGVVLLALYVAFLALEAGRNV